MNINRISLCIFGAFLATAVHSNLTAKSRLIEPTCDDDCEKIISHKNPMIIQFSAQWCGVCRAVKDPFEQVAQEKEFQNIEFVRVDIDKARGFSKKNGIQGVPSFLYLEKGSKKHEMVGVRNIKQFKDHLRQSLRSTFNTSS